MTTDLSALFAGLMEGPNGHNTGKKAKPYPDLTIGNDAQVMRLKEYAERYDEPCPYKVGDIVTPRSDVCLRGAGNPHVVLEVRKTPIHNFTDRPGTIDYGTRHDMRVAFFVDNDDIVTLWQESHMYEPYEGDGG